MWWKNIFQKKTRGQNKEDKGEIKYLATIRIKTNYPKEVLIAIKGDEVIKGEKCFIKYKATNKEVLIEVKAVDLSSFRAGINGVLRIMRCIEQTEKFLNTNKY